MTSRSLRPALALAGALPLVLLAACGQAADTAATPSPASSATATVPAEASLPAEAAGPGPRIVLTYDGGIQVLDALSFDVVADLPLEGFNRLNAAGDGRHALVSVAGGFRVLDAGTWAEPHGAHDHFYRSEPVLTDVTFAATKPGHVVVHHGRTALFDDGTGAVVVLDSDQIAGGLDAADDVREHASADAHHGVAIELTDGTFVASVGTEDARTGIQVLDADGDVLASSDECPGVHGEAVAADETVIIGCEDGALVVHDGTITKVQSPDAYGRIGNQAGSEASPVVLGDYKSDPDADLERPTRVALIDTETAELTLVDLPASYSFRSLARDDEGNGLVLGTDGQVHVIDVEDGTLVRSIPVVDAWEEPEEWQQPRPTIFWLDGSAYVTDPASKKIHAVDIASGEVWLSGDLTVAPNELNGVTGTNPEAGHAHDEHDDEHADEHGDEHHDDEHGDEHDEHDEHHDDDHEDDKG